MQNHTDRPNSELTGSLTSQYSPGRAPSRAGRAAAARCAASARAPFPTRQHDAQREYARPPAKPTLPTDLPVPSTLRLESKRHGTPWLPSRSSAHSLRRVANANRLAQRERRRPHALPPPDSPPRTAPSPKSGPWSRAGAAARAPRANDCGISHTASGETTKQHPPKKLTRLPPRHEQPPPVPAALARLHAPLLTSPPDLSSALNASFRRPQRNASVRRRAVSTAAAALGASP